MAKRPDWVMKSWTALTINEFILFDMFGSTCGRVVMRVQKLMSPAENPERERG